jgi:hypothetical protein
VITEYELYSDERKDTPRGFLILGGVVCTDRGRERLLTALARTRAHHRVDVEVHWKKTSTHCLSAYKAWLDVFFDDPHARFSVLTINRSSPDWQIFCRRMRRRPDHDDPLASAFYQFLLSTFGRLHDTRRRWAFSDAGYFSRDDVLQRVEYLFNSTYKKAFGPKTSRIIRVARALNSKRSDLVQLADIMLACTAISQFSLEPKSTARRELVHHFATRSTSTQVTRKQLPKITTRSWVPPERFKYL